MMFPATTRPLIAPRSTCLFLLLALTAGSIGCGDDDKQTPIDRDPAPATGSTSDGGKPRADGGGKGGVKRDGGTSSGGGGNVAQPPGGENKPMLEPLFIDECGDDNSAGLSSNEIDKLKAGGSTDGMRFLYPYDGTVFPRGLGGPELMWEGAGTKAVYLHITGESYEYTGCLKPDADGTLKVPDSAWAGAELQTLGRPYTVELSVLDGQTVRGPISEQLVIARATLKGSIYYNTYNSVGGGGLGIGGLGGTVERIKPGQKAEFFSRQAECTGCHSVSANGQRLVTKEVAGIQPGYVFSIDGDTQANPAPLRSATNVSFVGLSPDGSVYLTTAYQGLFGPPTEGAITTPAPLESFLVETDSGRTIDGSGFPRSAMMPTFSADGSLAAFNDYTRNNGGNISLIDYDAASRKAQNQRDLYTTTEGYTGWPFVLPDNGGVLFTQGESPAFSGGGAFITPAALRGPKSDLMTVDMESGQATILARAMGYNSVQDAQDGNTYLPFGAEEEHSAYYPTISPVAAGGYFWVFFDTIRHYGNKGLRRQLWVTAVAVQRRNIQEGLNNDEALYGIDHSSPAFYIPGQDFATANHRAFAALDPCALDGESCESGVDCCTGFCTDGVCGPPAMCATTNNKCKVDDDCCDKTEFCIGNICGPIAL
jgi:hypothetical protein